MCLEKSVELLELVLLVQVTMSFFFLFIYLNAKLNSTMKQFFKRTLEAEVLFLNYNGLKWHSMITVLCHRFEDSFLQLIKMSS